MDRGLAAIAVGGSMGTIVYTVLVAEWLIAVGVGAVYAASAYVYLRYPIAFSGRLDFEGQRSKLAKAIGVLGTSIGGSGFALQFAGSGTTIAFVLWITGTIAFLTAIQKAVEYEGIEYSSTRSADAAVGE
ncbi:hypothetical protein [Halococcus agarilyticus]|uniref:hypothetical protein n=1 Tax=Halococcus agarilyticus TaxID=1232219 RepID=UPI000677FE98|nr:hypothetical protein [Halococcus agarilyticus]